MTTDRREESIRTGRPRRWGVGPARAARESKRNPRGLHPSRLLPGLLTWGKTRVVSELENSRFGDPGDERSHSSDELLSLVYDELRRLAAAKLAREPAGQTLQPTALVHEAWLRLSNTGQRWDNPRHFYAAAAESMRRILVERARRRARLRHGGGLHRVNIERIDVAVEDNEDTVLFVDDALTRLAEVDPECAQLVALRFFAGVPNQEAARLLGLSERTAKRNWAYARAWLAKEIKRQNSASDG